MRAFRTAGDREAAGMKAAGPCGLRDHRQRQSRSARISGDSLAATETRMRMMTIAILLLAAPAPATLAHAAPAPGQARQCWLDAMSDAEKRALVEGYARIGRTEGKARADAWAQAQRSSYARKFAANGTCPAPRTASVPAPGRDDEPRQEQPVLNRDGKPCKRLELENRNVPNIGGSMGWALIQVCKD
jgi:hypothetical protein